MKRVLFIDRDGCLIIEPPDEQIDSLEKLEFYPGVFTALSRIARTEKFEFVMVTNQDGLGTDSFPEEKFLPAHEKMMKALANEGIRFSKVLIDKSLPHENKNTRKPGIGMLTEFLTGEYDLANSLVIGDRLSDIELAKNLGAQGILLGPETRQEELYKNRLEEHCLLVTPSWDEIARKVTAFSRKGSVHRKTKETDVEIELHLDGSGDTSCHTGLGFFDHMLDQLGKHGQLDLYVTALGDLDIDEHHTIEDTGLALGEAFIKALGDKRGIERYGFCLPMDDALASVSIDFGGRPYLVWEAEFKREKIGEMPTEMFPHFFKSFADAARCNINIKAEGLNEHHKIEAIFKAFAKAIKMAVRLNGTELLPTTKGSL